MPLRILVVDDEATNRHIIGMNLSMLGYEVIEAEEPVTAIAMARAEAPAIILMDLQFKGAPFDGVEAIRRLRADPETAHIPIIAQTASVLLYLEETLAEAGASGLLHKPFRRPQLVAAIRAALPDSPEPWPRMKCAPITNPITPVELT